MIIISLLLLFFLVPNIVITIQNDFKINFTFNIIKLINIILNDKMIIMGILMLEFLFILVLFYFKYNFKIRNTNSNNGIPKRIESNEFGSSRFSTMKEVKENFTTWKFGKENKAGGMVVAIDNNNYYVDTSSNHNLIIGSTGSGKTQSVIFPLIFNLADSGESMIINDVKGELFKTTYDYLKKKD